MSAIPITLSPNNRRDPAPHLYRVEHHTQVCEHCSRSHSWTQVWAQTHLKPLSHTPTGKYVSNLRPVSDPREIQWNIPVKCVDIPVRKVPFCHACYTTVTLSHLPTVPLPEQLPVNPLTATPGWNRAHAASKEAEKQAKEAAKAHAKAHAKAEKSRPWTADDLI